MLYLSLPIDLVGHFVRYTNINVFSEPHFQVYGQNLRTYTGKYGENPYMFIFYPV